MSRIGEWLCRLGWHRWRQQGPGTRICTRCGELQHWDYYLDEYN
jgi:hypothetical protein